MAHIPSGSDADSSQYNAHDDRIANLEANVLSTGGTGSLDSNLGWDEVQTTVSPTGSVTVNHGLGFTPSVVLVQLRGNPSNSGPYISYVSTITSSTFIVFFGQWTNDDTPQWKPAHSGQSVTFDWLGLK
jgi:hypothetical protein